MTTTQTQSRDSGGDLRGTPKGEARCWTLEPLVAERGMKRRVRKHYEITYCAEGFWSGSGSANQPYGDAGCVRVVTESAEGWTTVRHEFCSGMCVWRVDDRSRKRHWTRAYYCDADFPAALRTLIADCQQQQVGAP